MEEEVMYDAPENGGATNSSKETSNTFAKFDNPLYETN